MAKLNQRSQCKMTPDFIHWFCRNCFSLFQIQEKLHKSLKIKVTGHRKKQIEKADKHNPDEISSFLRPSGLSLWWMTKPCFQLLVLISNVSFINQKVFANSNVSAILLQQMKKKITCVFSNTRHCMKPIKMSYIYSIIPFLCAYGFSLHLWQLG